MTLAERRGFEVEVYEPSEDSRLLATAVERDLQDWVTGARILDVGTGSGFVAARLAALPGVRVVGSDINPRACRRALARGIEVVRADLVSAFDNETFDAVVFNPPYLPADPEASWDDWFEVAVTGGPSGRAVIERFLEDAGRVLTRDGALYLLVSTYTGVEAVIDFAGQRGFSSVALEDAVFPGETLTALKLVQ